jgi:hypothetical protein
MRLGPGGDPEGVRRDRINNWGTITRREHLADQSRRRELRRDVPRKSIEARERRAARRRGG